MKKEQFIQSLNKHSNYYISKNNLQHIINQCTNDNKKKKLISFQNSLVSSEYINPIFMLNNVGGVSLSKPSIPFSMAEIPCVFCFKHSIQFNDLDELIAFLVKFKSIIWRYKDTTAFMAVGTTLYCSAMGPWLEIPWEYTKQEFELMEVLIAELWDKYLLKNY